MTLLLGLHAGRYLLQTADRRLTYDDGGVHDDASNKQIVYRLKDGLFLLAYTGDAGIRGIPTDCWIVEQLLQHRFSREGLIGIRGRNSLRGGYGQHFIRLRDALTAELNRSMAFRRGGIEIVGLGMVGRNGWWAPVCFELARRGAHYAINWSMDRDWRLRAKWLRDRGPGSFTCVFAPSSNANSLSGQLRRELRAHHQFDMDGMEKSLVETTRSTSQVDPRVGKDVLAVAVCLPLEQMGIRIRFYPGETESLGAGERPALYGPWMVGLSFIWAPQVLNVPQKWTFEGIQLRYETMSPRAHLLPNQPFELSSLPRKPLPA
ncbi:hypothetical protein [Desertibaculum subflavum]|uniref:hypothetical protein n=1 Tax=Desertibaculum subflavum TaxID=2268458 RepID=UPI000E66066B